jgi:hypothetical protein
MDLSLFSKFQPWTQCLFFNFCSGQSLHRRQHRVQRPAGGRRPPLALRPPQELPEGAAGAPARPEELCRLPDVVRRGTPSRSYHSHQGDHSHFTPRTPAQGGHQHTVPCKGKTIDKVKLIF